jgi:translation initiation factor IF-3
MIQFRGREQSRPELGIKLLQKFSEDVAEFGTAENRPKQDGRNMVMIVAPVKNKSEAKAEQNARRTQQKQAARAAKNAAAEEKSNDSAEAAATETKEN